MTQGSPSTGVQPPFTTVVDGGVTSAAVVAAGFAVVVWDAVVALVAAIVVVVVAGVAADEVVTPLPMHKKCHRPSPVGHCPNFSSNPLQQGTCEPVIHGSRATSVQPPSLPSTPAAVPLSCARRDNLRFHLSCCRWMRTWSDDGPTRSSRSSFKHALSFGLASHWLEVNASPLKQLAGLVKRPPNK